MARGEEKNKKKRDTASEAVSWQEKKELTDIDEKAIRKEVEEFMSWTTMIETMDDKQLKEYVQNRQESFHSEKSAPTKKVQRNRKLRTTSPSRGIMAAVWKFHKEDDAGSAAIGA